MKNIHETIWSKVKETNVRTVPYVHAFRNVFVFSIVCSVLIILHAVRTGQDVTIFLFLAWIPFVMWCMMVVVSMFVLYVSVASRERSHFWKKIAADSGWDYETSPDVSKEKALFLTKGHSINIKNQIVGDTEVGQVRVFESSFMTGRGKYRTVYSYTAYAFRYAGTFPHCFLDRRDNKYSFAEALVPIAVLPKEFQKKFELFTPPDYEQTALQIFTPDVLEYLLQVDWQYDIELVEHELIVYRPGWINTLERFQTDLKQVTALASYMKARLDGMRYVELGSCPSSLRDFMNSARHTALLGNPTRRLTRERIFVYLCIVLLVSGIVGGFLGIHWLLYVGVLGSFLVLMGLVASLHENP